MGLVGGLYRRAYGDALWPLANYAAVIWSVCRLPAAVMVTTGP
jgi:hypothetical protein